MVSSVSSLRLRLLHITGGDPNQATALHAMMWDAYCDAGRPLGPDDAAMWVWWSYGAGSTNQ